MQFLVTQNDQIFNKFTSLSRDSGFSPNAQYTGKMILNGEERDSTEHVRSSAFHMTPKLILSENYIVSNLGRRSVT